MTEEHLSLERNAMARLRLKENCNIISSSSSPGPILLWYKKYLSELTVKLTSEA